MSTGRLFKFWITAWPNLGNKGTENGNNSMGSFFFTVVKTSSGLLLKVGLVTAADLFHNNFPPSGEQPDHRKLAHEL